MVVASEASVKSSGPSQNSKSRNSGSSLVSFIGMMSRSRVEWIFRCGAGLGIGLAVAALPRVGRGGLFDDPPPGAARDATPSAAGAGVAWTFPQPIPNNFQIGNVEKLLRQVYGAALDGKSPDELDDLARKLFEQAGQSADPAEQWVLLKETRDRAARAGDASLAFDAVGMTQERFDCDPRGLLEEVLSGLATTTHPKADAAQAEMRLARRCMAQAEFDLAAKALDTAQRVARACRDVAIEWESAQAAHTIDLAIEARKNALPAMQKLKSQPKDPQACTEVGRYKCFTLGEWPAGLGLLSQGSDPALRALALTELAPPDSPSARLSLAGRWIEAAAQDPADADACRHRAEHWDRLAIQQLDGLARLSAEKRLQQLAAHQLEPGVVCELFIGRSFERRMLTRVDPQINYPWDGKPPAPGLPAEFFSARLSAWIKPPVSGQYTLTLDHDDGARLWIDGRPVIDDWVMGARAQSATVELSAVYHDLRVEYEQGRGPSRLKLSWTTPTDSAETPVPAEVFFHEPLEIAAQLQTPLESVPDGTVHLKPAFAGVHGSTGRYVDDEGATPSIVLQSPATYASWDVALAEGKYIAELTYAYRGDSEIHYLVTIGPAGFRGAGDGSGGPDHPKVAPLGAVKLGAGTHRITVRATTPGSKELRIQEITLKPKA
jgi:hypothetical protein